MHISEGILAGPVLAGGFAATALLAAVTMRKMDIEEIPKISVITSVFFVANFIHVPLGPASVHLILNGLAGVVLGWRAFPAIMLGVILQAILFGHGGVSVIGVNSVMLGGGALCAYMVWRMRHWISFAQKEMVFGALAAAVATMTSGVVLALALMTKGDAFWSVAMTALVAHVPVMIVEAVVVGASAGYLARVRPQVLAGNVPARAKRAAAGDAS